MNVLAIVALVTGILALFPIAIGTGIAALMQIRRRQQAGAGLAIAGIVLGGVYLIIGVVVAAVTFLPSDDLGYPYLGRVANAGSTTAGDCLREPPDDDGQATRVPCSTGHDAEIFLVTDLGSSSWPGDEGLDQRSDDACYDAFERYVGLSYDDSEYDYGFFGPDQAEWEAGEHRAVCVILPGSDELLRESVRGINR